MQATRKTQPYDDAFGHWFAGFFDGEGSFGIYPANVKRGRASGWRCLAKISLRADDRPILEEITAKIGLGWIYLDKKGTAAAAAGRNPNVGWFVQNRVSCMALVDVFERYPLRAKKAADFEVWARAVREWVSSPLGAKGRDWAAMESLADELRSGREYVEEREAS